MSAALAHGTMKSWRSSAQQLLARLRGVAPLVVLLLTLVAVVGPWAAQRSSSGSSSSSPRFAALSLGAPVSTAARSTANSSLAALQASPVCTFLASGAANVRHEKRWGQHRMCNTPAFDAALTAAHAHCVSCLTGANVCNPSSSAAPAILYHQFLDTLHPTLPQGNLLSIKAYLMTQDVRRTRLTVWTPSRQHLLAGSPAVAAFFHTWRAHVELREFHYDAQVARTPWATDPFFGNHTAVRAAMIAPATYSDVVRLLLLHNHGGLWLDNDIILYRDLSHLLSISYQFVLRWTNNAVMFMAARSPLMARLMRLAAEMPVNHPRFTADVIRGRCQAFGYKPVLQKVYGFTDVFNMCLLRIALKEAANTEQGAAAAGLGPEGRLFDLPVSWFDNDWAKCFRIENWSPLSDAAWRNHMASPSRLAMHSRYPKLASYPPKSPLDRLIRLIDGFFDACASPKCLPRQGLPILAYEGYRGVLPQPQPPQPQQQPQPPQPQQQPQQQQQQQQQQQPQMQLQLQREVKTAASEVKTAAAKLRGL